MVSNPLRPSALPWRFVVSTSMALLLAAWMSPAAWSQNPAPTPQTPFTPHSLARIPPGTRINDRAPVGWSHLVVKNLPKVTSGDLDSVPSITVDMASLFFNSLMLRIDKVDVQGQPPRFRLGQVAAGLGTRIGGQDTVISSETYKALGADLGFIGGMVLSKSEEQMNLVLEVGRSPTMSIVDSPITMLINNQHVSVILRYAFLVDPRDGRAYTLAWILDKAPGGLRLSNTQPMILMKPNLVTQCRLHVDSSKFFLGTPSPEAFAVIGMPDGNPVAMPEQAKPLAVARQFTPASAYQLELELWKAVFPPKR